MAVVRAAVPSDMAPLVESLDRAFVFDKGRRISLARRFPHVYSAANASNVFIAEEGGAVLSTIACRRFDWICDKACWRGAMVGSVHTEPHHRGQGLAGRLLAHGMEALRTDGLDFAVLWTDQTAFYARLGWISADCGMLGEVSRPAVSVLGEGRVDRLPASAADAGQAERVERLRAAAPYCRIPRRPTDYACLPLPAESVHLLLWSEGVDAAAYALVGLAKETAILYEMVGDPRGFPSLWYEVCQGAVRVLVNDLRDSPSQHWLAEYTDVMWIHKPLAMWLPLSGRVDPAGFADWYVPYLDRI